MSQEIPREEVRAALEAQRELDPEYRPAIVDSIVERLDATIKERVKAEVEARSPGQTTKHDPSSVMGWSVLLGAITTWVIIGNLAADYLAPLIVVWTAIVAVNLANALSRRRRD